MEGPIFGILRYFQKACTVLSGHPDITENHE